MAGKRVNANSRANLGDFLKFAPSTYETRIFFLIIGHNQPTFLLISLTFNSSLPAVSGPSSAITRGGV